MPMHDDWTAASEPVCPIPWEEVDTVLLDMDGVLLDLCFDNFFWEEYIPQRYGKANGLSPEAAREEVLCRYAKAKGTIEWYSPEHWSRELGLDVGKLEQQQITKVRMHPDAEAFLSNLRQSGRPALLVTNANPAGLASKLEHTGLSALLDEIFSSHHFGQPKEQPAFWTRLQERYPFSPERTLLIDDSEAVLDAAREYGVRHLRTVLQPDRSRAPRRNLRFPVLGRLGEAAPPRR